MSSDGGKGSAPRPFTDQETYLENHSRIFGKSRFERRLEEEAERKKREAALEEMVRINEELGLYDDVYNNAENPLIKK